MKQILVYSDSLTWGIVPDTRRRFLFDERWPGVMEEALRAEGHDVRTVEDCLNGRRTVFDDPYKPGRNGLVGVEQRIEINSPLALVILMLGTNDFQSIHAHNAAQSAQGIATLVDAIRRAPIGPGMPVSTCSGSAAIGHEPILIGAAYVPRYRSAWGRRVMTCVSSPRRSSDDAGSRLSRA